MVTPRAGAGLAALLVLALAAPPSPRGGGAPAEPLRPAAGVRDPALALLVGLIDDDRRGIFTREQVREAIDAGGRRTRVPLDAFGSMTRTAAGGARHRADLRVIFRGNGEIPIPYDILGYRPGKLRASHELRLSEWSLGDLRFAPGRVGTGGSSVIELRDLRVWGITDGSCDLDIDGWLDRLLGSALDDTRMVGFALFTFEGRRVGMAMGYNREGRGYSGAFLLEEDRILHPFPDEYKAMGRLLRARVELLLERSAGPGLSPARPG